MVLDSTRWTQVEGQLYHGVDSVHMISFLSSPGTFFNKLNATVFKHQAVAKIVYPILVMFRNLTLRILGRKKLALD